MEKYLSAEDKNKFYAWVADFHGDFNVDNYLQPWYDNKNKYLFNMFGGQLIHSKEWLYNKTSQLKEIKFKRDYYDHYGIFTETLRTCIEGILLDGHSVMWTPNRYYSAYINLNMLQAIVDGNLKLTRPLTIIDNNNNKCIFHVGERWVKAARKFTKFLNKAVETHSEEEKTEFIDNLNKLSASIEQLANDVSVINSNSKVKAKISISIHPLDYLTMSDNDCGWQSCMSWEDNGCYHAGTVEMMNSPCVVVAYLEASKSLHRDLYKCSNWEWNNKRWRCLFIVDKNFICGVKQYPYEDSALLDAMVLWLADLAEENLGWQYSKVIQRGMEAIRPDGKRQDFCTGLMYQDIHPTNIPAIVWSETFDDALARYYDYSAPAYCPICGEPLEIAELTTCPKCEGWIRCEGCGDWIQGDSDYAYWVGDACYCENCHNDLYEQCCWCDEDIHYDETIALNAAYTYDGSFFVCHIACYCCEACLQDILEKYGDWFEQVNDRKYKLLTDCDANIVKEIMAEVFHVYNDTTRAGFRICS